MAAPWKTVPRKPLPSPAGVVDQSAPLDLDRMPGVVVAVVAADNMTPPHQQRTDAGDASLLWDGPAVPARRMWGWGPGLRGYCGECCFQMAALHFGTYVSQERVRYFAGNNELLIGLHEEKVARRLRLLHTSFDTEGEPEPQGERFLAWAARETSAGNLVIAGWQMHGEKGTDDDYDHIMPLVAVARSAPRPPTTTSTQAQSQGSEAARRSGSSSSSSSRTGKTIAAVAFWDLAQRHRRTLWGDQMLRTRAASRLEPAVGSMDDDEGSALETRYQYSLPRSRCYAVTIRGVVDPHREARRFALQPIAPDNWDEPDWGAEDERGEAPRVIWLSGLASGLEPGRRYALLRFDDVDAVPAKAKDKGFLDCRRWSAAFTFTAPAPCVQLVRFDRVRSDGIAAYRLVAAADRQ